MGRQYPPEFSYRDVRRARCVRSALPQEPREGHRTDADAHSRDHATVVLERHAGNRYSWGFWESSVLFDRHAESADSPASETEPRGAGRRPPCPRPTRPNYAARTDVE